MEGKEVKTPQTRRNALTIGIGSQETADRFLAMKNGTTAATYEEAVKLLLDAYENKYVDTGNSETVANLKKRIEELEEQLEAKDRDIADLQKQVKSLEEDNALMISDAEKTVAIISAYEKSIILKPNPVTAYFLKEMAEREGTDPGKILERLFMDDLQNPRANNLPYTVSASRIREVMEELKQQNE